MSTNFDDSTKTEIAKKDNKNHIAVTIIGILLIAAIVVIGGMYYYQGLDSTKYKQGNKAIESGDYNKAIEIFDSIKYYSDAESKIEEAEYQLGINEYNNKNYEAAKEHFKAAHGYDNSSDLIDSCVYETAKNMMSAGQYSEAKAALSSINELEDSSELIKECSYQIACADLINGNAMSSRTAFLELGEYKDSKQKAKEATEICKEEIYENGVQYYLDGAFQLAYDELKDISGYKDVEKYLRLTNVMLSFSGVYRNEYKKKEYANYLIIHKWDLYHRGTQKGDMNAQDRVVLVEVDDDTDYEYALVDEKYKDNPNIASVKYYLLEEYDGDNKRVKGLGLKAINPVYRKKGSYLEYVWDSSTTFEELEAVYQARLSRVPPSIGMTAEQVKSSTWGEPEKINKTTTASGVEEQWCYTSPRRYIYLRDGVVTQIQE